MRIEYQPTVHNSLNSSLTLDFSNASPDVQDVNTLLQNLLEKFYPSWDGTIFDNGYNVSSPIQYFQKSGGSSGYTLDDSGSTISLYVPGGTNYPFGSYASGVKCDFSKFKTIRFVGTIANGASDGWTQFGFAFSDNPILNRSDILTTTNFVAENKATGSVVSFDKSLDIRSLVSQTNETYLNLFIYVAESANNINKTVTITKIILS